MPEGPSIVILREEAQRFAGRRVLRVSGNSGQDIGRLQGRTLRAVRSWGKHFLLQFDGFSVRIHFLLFGSYRINEEKAATPRLSLGFSKGEALHVYACSVQFIEADLDAVYDWSGDVMNEAWDAAAARRKLRARPDALVADALLDQEVFAGVGNIIKNEVLHRIRVHPESRIGALPPRKLSELVAQARAYSFDFYRWKRAFALKKHYQVHTKTTCPRDDTLLSYRRQLGRAQRRAFWCDHCQRLYDDGAATSGAETAAPPPPRALRRAART
ncbi:DNA-formamidopyrimidine glycosylase family protein [Xanthomonas sp. XNM01]|uniref:DNA-formamidopyrimidine glycosylase family protein n=1 Tax=Xanthomonas sp. XNM01 TaxID=2769289 RepID=UPI00177B1E88|nr:DNA-formamidopyrimidine glycosylase family protein [Xanthomonas sp. XNM01]MBD9368524.1 endonuclease [Xanthomonas sp. XNM01]